MPTRPTRSDPAIGATASTAARRQHPGRDPGPARPLLAILAFAWWPSLLAGQRPPAARATPPPAPATAKSNATPTHAPLPALPPLAAFVHVKTGNEACVQALAAGQSPPPPRERPAGAGRYVAAVFVCADADIDVGALTGLARRDILLISTPGPFVQAEAVALIERAVREERLSLVVLLTHRDCRTLATVRADSSSTATLAHRLAVAAEQAQQRRRALADVFASIQREHLLAASELLREQQKLDALRILPGEVDTRTGAISWMHDRGEAMPIAPVR